ncbi:aromatic compound monooxygenase [Acrasis kona]|uniref:Aromatic compound monooxygenase n=1 Tax=Acrasis kona TaxID=1008807 RepID=A0AAW2ZGF5_9EUKA
MLYKFSKINVFKIMPTTQVLIIGAGPTGLVLGMELAAANVHFRIVEKATERSDKSRALALQARTTELMERYNIADELYKRGTQVEAIDIYLNKNKPFSIDGASFAATSDCNRPFPTLLSQQVTESILEEKLKQFNKSVEYGVLVKSLSQDQQQCTTVLQHPDGTIETILSDYIAGCDGCHSIVRHSCPTMKFEGDAYEKTFALMDCNIEWENDISRRISIMSGYGTVGVFPMGGDKYRIFMPSEEIGDVSKEEFDKALQKVCPLNANIKEVFWSTRYKLHHRLSSTYQENRFFILGDAAHIHSPAGGQGMNTGIQDATNLGWKLAHVLHNRADSTYLESYNNERRQIGQNILNYTDRMFGLVTSDSYVQLMVKNYIVPWIAPFVINSDAVQKRGFGFGSQLRIRYSKSDIVDKECGNGGLRAPDGDVIHCINGTKKRLYQMFTPGKFILLIFENGSIPEIKVPDWMIYYQVIKESDDFKSNNIAILNDPFGKVSKLYGDNRVVYIRPDAYIATSALSTFEKLNTFIERDCKEKLNLVI